MAFRTLLLIVFGVAALAGACDPSEQDPPEQTGECAVDEGTSARFEVDVGKWPAAGDNLEIAARCTVGAVGSTISLDCEDGKLSRRVTLQLSASPELTPPVVAGDAVDFTLTRKADASPDRGFWRLNAPDGALLLAGARGYASTPSSDANFFAPLSVDIDLQTCDERKTDSCRLEQRVVLEVHDGATTTRVPHGASVKLPSGHELRVGRAMLSMSSGDPKVCPLDESTPETYEYLIAAGT